MKLIFARHGETVENKKGLIQGWLPGRLIRKGKEQAKDLAKKLIREDIDVIYTSDLDRAYDTAKIIYASHEHSKFFKSKLLRERNYGIFQGNPKHKINWKKIDDEFYSEKIAKGESISQVRKRAEKFLNILTKKHQDKTVLAVGHGFYGLVLNSVIKNISLKESILKGEHKNADMKVYLIE